MTNRAKMIEGLIQNFKSELMDLGDYALAKEVFNNMKCKNCPLHTQECDEMTCFENAYKFISESEVKG